MSTKRILQIVLVASALMLASGFSPRVTNPARALPLTQTSVTVPYSGSLAGEAGQPVADGAYDFTFALYEAESSGKPLWTEAVEGVMVQEGNFTVLLGSVDPLPETALDGGARWLEVGVRGSGETGFTQLSPRQELKAAAPGAPSSPSAASSCAHDHWGEYWSGSDVGLHLSSSNDTGLWAESAGGWAGVDGRNTTGIGVFGEATTTDTNGATGVWGEVWSYGDTVRGVLGWARNTSGVSVGVWGQSQSAAGTGVKGVATNSSCTSGYWGTCSGVFGNSTKGNGLNGATDTGIAIYGATSSGIGLKIESQVSGNLIEAWHGPLFSDREFYVDNDGDVYADGTYYGAGGVSAGNADFAEMMRPGQMDLEPGDVLAVDPDGGMVLSTMPYQATVVGVYSTEPGFVAGNKLDEEGNPLEPDRIPLAVIGVVPVKASAENGAIHPGDLLVASSTPGHAMKAGSDPAVGTVIGKALGSLESGTGVIQMLVMLQ